MQSLARKLLEGLDQRRTRGWRNAEATAVDRITHQREVHISHVHTNLVGTAGFQLHACVRMGTEALQHPVMADGGLAPGDDGHALTLLAMTADRRIYLATGRDHPDHYSLVHATHATRLQLCDQAGMSLEGLGDHHQTGGVLVQAMDDAGTRHVLEPRHMVQQGVEQCAIGMPSSWMHHQSGGLVQHQQVIVLEDDIQLDVLGYPLALRLLLGIQLQQSAAVHDVARTQHAAVNGEEPVLDPAGKAGAGVLGKELRSDLVETLPAQFGRHFGAELNDVLGIGRHARERRGRSLWFQLRACG